MKNKNKTKSNTIKVVKMITLEEFVKQYDESLSKLFSDLEKDNASGALDKEIEEQYQKSLKWYEKILFRLFD